MLRIHGRHPDSQEAIAVEVAGGIITSMETTQQTAEAWISPGLVDLQINGFAGIDINAPGCRPEEISRLARVLAARGTTTFLPTVITNSSAAVASALAAIRQAREQDAFAHKAIPCVHLEGPWLSPEDGFRGAHDVRHIVPPSVDQFDQWQEISGGLIGLVTISPHWESSVATIRELQQRHVLVAIGHTHATGEQIRAAVDAGATLSTHLGNALPAMLHRHKNPVWAQLAEERLHPTLIADGFHLPDDFLRTALAVKGTQRCILVSDAVALAGSAPGNYQTYVGDGVTMRPDGSIRMSGSELLAGSGISLLDAVSYAANVEGITLANALRMATRNPAGILGQRSRLEVGAPADLITFHWQQGGPLRLEHVYVGGERVELPAA